MLYTRVCESERDVVVMCECVCVCTITISAAHLRVEGMGFFFCWCGEIYLAKLCVRGWRRSGWNRPCLSNVLPAFVSNFVCACVSSIHGSFHMGHTLRVRLSCVAVCVYVCECVCVYAVCVRTQNQYKIICINCFRRRQICTRMSIK